MRKHLITITYLASLFLPGCSIYKIDIQQGNIVTQDAINQLRPRMNPRQVRYVMGSPLLVDVFHQNRWDYIYSNQPGGGERTQRRVSLYFENDELVAIQGDFRPNAVPLLEEAKADATVEVPPRVIEKGIFEKIMGLFGIDSDIGGTEL